MVRVPIEFLFLRLRIGRRTRSRSSIRQPRHIDLTLVEDVEWEEVGYVGRWFVSQGEGRRIVKSEIIGVKMYKDIWSG